MKKFEVRNLGEARPDVSGNPITFARSKGAVMLRGSNVKPELAAQAQHMLAMQGVPNVSFSVDALITPRFDERMTWPEEVTGDKLLKKYDPNFIERALRLREVMNRLPWQEYMLTPDIVVAEGVAAPIALLDMYIQGRIEAVQKQKAADEAKRNGEKFVATETQAASIVLVEPIFPQHEELVVAARGTKVPHSLDYMDASAAKLRGNKSSSLVAEVGKNSQIIVVGEASGCNSVVDLGAAFFGSIAMPVQYPSAKVGGGEGISRIYTDPRNTIPTIAGCVSTARTLH